MFGYTSYCKVVNSKQQRRLIKERKSMATLIYRRTMQVHMDKLSEAMEIATEQAKIFKELTGNDELVSFQIGGNPRTICRAK